MKKKALILIGIAMLAIAIAIVFVKANGTKPFRDMTADTIESASVTIAPPDTITTLTKEDSQQLVTLLREVVVYKEDNSYTQYAGQSVAFVITQTDGTQVVVSTYAPFIVINGVGYRAKQSACSKLQDFAMQFNTKPIYEEASDAPVVDASQPEDKDAADNVPSTDATYHFTRYGKDGEVISIAALTDEKLAESIIMDVLSKSAAWQGVDIATLEEYYLIEQTLTATDETHEYYAYLLDDKAVLQSGNNGMYSYLSQELYDALDGIYTNAVERTDTKLPRLVTQTAGA